MRKLVVLLLALIAVPAAHAFSVTVNTADPVTAPGVTLNGVDQSQTFTISIGVSDANPGSGNGWHVDTSATTPSNGANTLPALIVTDVVAGTCSGGSCAQPTNHITWPITLSTTAQKIFNADVGTGTKSQSLTATFKITYPANAVAVTYSSTVTITGQNNGP